MAVAFSALTFANSYIEVRAANEEFAQATEVGRTLRGLAGGLAVQPSATGFVSFRFTRVTPNTLATGSTLTLTLLNGTSGSWTPSWSPLPVTVWQATSRAERQAGVVAGETGLIVVGAGSAIGTLQRNYTTQTTLTLDFARIRISNGTQSFYNQTTQVYETWNVVEITVIELVPGTRTGAQVFSLQNTGLVVNQVRMDGNGTIRVTTDYLGSRTEEVRISDLGLDPARPTLVTIVRAQLVLSQEG
jgi:hypothetical protein